MLNLLLAEENWPIIKGKYFGQEPPGNVPQLFASEILTNSINTVFSPDGTEFFFVKDMDGNNTGDILWIRQINGQWGRPIAAPFNSNYTDNDVCISHDGIKVFFRSWRPVKGKTLKESASHIWFSQKIEGRWSEPELVRYNGSNLRAGYPSVAISGNLYFPKIMDKNKKYGDLFYLKNRDGNFTELIPPENDPGNLYNEGDMCVAPDESFVITACWERPESSGGGKSDLYISFRLDNKKWSHLIHMGNLINTELMENCPTISPDGKYFFFMKYDGNPVMLIGLAVILQRN